MKIIVNNETYETIRGKTILDVLKVQGVSIPHECDGKCTCGTCTVEILHGEQFLSPIQGNEKAHLSQRGYASNCRLACQSVLFGEVEVRTL